MAELNYSDDAINVYSAFYGAEKILYVEGEDDCIFWDLILNKFDVKKLKVIEVGGAKELFKYLEKINAGDIDALAAKDVDFSTLEDGYVHSDKIMSTYGHSIENTIVCIDVIKKVARSHGRIILSVEDERQCRIWLDNFFEAFSALVVYDAINEIEEAGDLILADNCTRFMRSKISPIPDESKIRTHIVSLNLEQRYVSQRLHVVNKIQGSSRQISDFIRGHFYFSGALKYVNNIIKKNGSNKNASKDSFFSSAILAFEAGFNDKHPHFEHYANEIERVVS